MGVGETTYINEEWLISIFCVDAFNMSIYNFYKSLIDSMKE